MSERIGKHAFLATLGIDGEKGLGHHAPTPLRKPERHGSPINLWGSGLLPLILGSAIVPIQPHPVTTALRSSSGRITSVAFVAGMVSSTPAGDRLRPDPEFRQQHSPLEADGATSPVTGALLLVVGVLMLVLAVRSLLNEPDPDSPPPKWLAMTASIKPAKAYLLGAGLIWIGAKFWVFTLSAIGVIGDAGLAGPRRSRRSCSSWRLESSR